MHPLRVESVAWVADAKNVLSGLFFVLTLAAYLGYVRSPTSIFRSLLLPCVFTLGLLCKPMLVTVPFVLLLLDYWPLRRSAGWSSASLGKVQPVPAETQVQPTPHRPNRLLLEKLPLHTFRLFMRRRASAKTPAMARRKRSASGRRLENSFSPTRNT